MEERVYFAIIPTRNIKVAWWNSKTNYLGYINSDRDESTYRFISKNVRTRYKRKDKVIYMDYFTKRDETRMETIRVINPLPGQPHTKEVDMSHLDTSIPGSWDNRVKFSEKRFMEIRNAMKQFKLNHWIVSRRTWQQFCGIDQYLKPGMTSAETSLVYKAKTLERFGKNINAYWCPAMMLLAFAIDAKLCYYHLTDGEYRRYF